MQILKNCAHLSINPVYLNLSFDFRLFDIIQLTAISRKAEIDKKKHIIFKFFKKYLLLFIGAVLASVGLKILYFFYIKLTISLKYNL